MTDTELGEKYQDSSKRCVVVFEDINEMNIIRERPMVTLPTETSTAGNPSNAQDDSNTVLPSSTVFSSHKEIKVLVPPKGT